jgi:hypothetical protein
MRGRLPEAVRTRPKTPLFDAQTADPATNPWHRRALRDEVKRERRDLLETAGLEAYVDIAAVSALVDAPVPRTVPPTLDPVFDLAHWLRGAVSPVVTDNMR